MYVLCYFLLCAWGHNASSEYEITPFQESIIVTFIRGINLPDGGSATGGGFFFFFFFSVVYAFVKGQRCKHNFPTEINNVKDSLRL